MSAEALRVGRGLRDAVACALLAIDGPPVALVRAPLRVLLGSGSPGSAPCGPGPARPRPPLSLLLVFRASYPGPGRPTSCL